MKLFIICILLLCFIEFNEAYPVVDWISELSDQKIPHPDIPYDKIPRPDLSYYKIPLPALSIPFESAKLEKVRSVLRKGYEFYKAVDEIKDREEYRIIEAMDQIPLNCLLDTDEFGKPEDDAERPRSLPKYVWKVAKLLFKKTIDTTIALGRSKDN